jgi:hypothetical protein
MPKRGPWGVAVAAALCLGGALRAADPPADEPPAEQAEKTEKAESKGWTLPWMKPKEKAPPRKAPAGKARSKEAASDEPASAKRPSPAEEAARERSREEAALLRRLAVCDQLRLVAVQKKDDGLLREVELLDQRVREVYARKTAHLPAAKLESGAAAKAGRDSSSALVKEDKP